jgi:hypothetical protein
MLGKRIDYSISDQAVRRASDPKALDLQVHKSALEIIGMPHSLIVSSLKFRDLRSYGN